MNASQGIAAAADLPNIRLMVVGNRHDCADPIEDFYPSINDSAHPPAHPWARASPANVGFGPDVVGGAGGGFSATCWCFGMARQLRPKKKKMQFAPSRKHQSQKRQRGAVRNLHCTVLHDNM